MPNYDLDRLGDNEFEHLIQALLKKVIGDGTITFGEGPDGGREATFSGRANYPSPVEQWGGKWIFQAKFHNTRLLGPDKARKQIKQDLESELEKITNKYQRQCDNYILATNVPLTSVHELGTHDQIAQEIIPNFADKIPNIHVWGYDDISRLLDVHTDVRQSYFHLISPGDLIAELLEHIGTAKSELAETVQLYLRTSFERDQYAQLDQAGEIGEQPVLLRQVFIDLNVKVRNPRDMAAILVSESRILGNDLRIDPEGTMSATDVLIRGDSSKIVLIGGPGQGKSTLGQFITQIHRAYLLERIDELNGDTDKFVPNTVRIPFRIVLRDYAQWIADAGELSSTEMYLASVVTEHAGRSVTSDQIQTIVKENPCLIVLDGLDEVTDRNLQAKMLQLLREFMGRCKDVLSSDLQIVATSRPTGYSNQFDPADFLHFELTKLDVNKIHEYVNKWITAKGIEPAKSKSLSASISDCASDAHFAALMTTPLQVTIFILIILNGGTPPRQKEELFDEYLEVIYKRERAKSKTIIQTEKRLLFGLHQYLGYILQRRASESADTRSRLDEKEFRQEVFLYLSNQDPYSDSEKLLQIADQMVSEARDRLVLLVEPEPGYFGFELRSIQEFFAAGYLVDEANGDEQRFKRFMAIALPPHWQNVALFFAGRVGRLHPGEAAQILEACREIDRHKPDYFAKHGALLALDIAVDRSFGPNQILQRSAIECALTLLDNNLVSSGYYEYLARLMELGTADIQNHVLPALSERLKRIRLPVESATLDIFRELEGDSQTANVILTFALEKGDISGEYYFEKALEYRIDAEHFHKQVQESLINWPQSTLVNCLISTFQKAPSYTANVLGYLKVSVETVRSLFWVASECDSVPGPRYRSFAEYDGPLPAINQIIFAWELISIAKGPIALRNRRRFPYYLQTFGRQFTEDVQQELISISSEKTTVIEFKAAALGVFAKSLFSESGGEIPAVLSEFASSLNNEQAEMVDRILFNMNAPSLEMLDRLAGIDMRRMMTQRILYNYKRRPEIRTLFMTDPLRSDHLAQVYEHTGDVPSLFEHVPPDLVGAGLRIGALHTSGPDSILPARISQALIHTCTSILLNEDNSAWRAWATLSRLSLGKWSSKSLASSPTKVDKWEEAVACLTDAIEGVLDNLCGRWEIGALLMRSVEIGVGSPLIERLLALLDRMSAGPIPLKESRAFYPQRVFKSTVAKLVNISVDSTDSALHGFLKWYAVLNQGTWIDDEKLIKLRLAASTKNKLRERVLDSADSAEGLIREGAFLILAHSGAISIEQAKKLLKSSRSDFEDQGLPWEELVSSSIGDSPSDETIQFLEHLMAAPDDYAKPVRSAALREYKRLSRNTLIDIKQQEGELGLPFQITPYKE